MAKSPVATVNLADLIKSAKQSAKGEQGAPFAQVLTPISGYQALPDWENKPDVLGLGVTAENAERVNFKPSEEWTLETRVLGGQPVKIWMTKSPRFVLVCSGPAAVEKVVKQGTRTFTTLHPYFAPEGGITDIGRDADMRKEGHTKVRKYGIILLNSKNEPLHEGILSLKVKGGFSVTLGFAQKQLKASIGTLLGEKPEKLGPYTHLMVHALNLSAYKSNAASSSAYTYVSGIQVIGTKDKTMTDTSTTPAREVDLIGKPAETLFIFEQLYPDLYARITELREQHKADFYLEGEEKQEETAVDVEGFFDMSSKMQFQKDGSLELSFVDREGNMYSVLVSPDRTEEIADLEDKEPVSYRLEGTLKDGLLVPTLMLASYDNDPL